MNVGRLSLENLEEYGEYESLYYFDKPFTNRQRLEWAADLAAVLRDRGVGVDDKVVVMMPNSPEVTGAFQAIWKLGAVIIPVTPQLGPSEVGYMLQDSAAGTVITTPELASRVAEARDGISTCQQLLTLGASDAAGAVDISGEVGAARGSFEIDHLENRADDDLALLLYTSGTTGNPKGVMLTHRNMMSNADSIAKMERAAGPYERALHVLPLSHSYGVLIMNLSYRFGGVGVLMPFFEIEGVFRNLEKYEIETFSVVPTMLTYMLNYPERAKFDLSALKRVGSGGAALANEVRLEFERVFDCDVKEGYGMSECAPSATGYEDTDTYRVGSVGRAIPDVEISIRNTEDAEVSRGEWGEICIKGPNVMAGYWNKPEATEETLRGGWLHSGDVGYMDDDGYVYITDRMKDLIIKGGENISPREIEEAIFGHPAVAEVAVFGVPHDTYGEDVCAAVVRRAGQDADEGDIRAQAAGAVTKFKVPAKVVFLDDLPKSGNGKILKRELRDLVAKSADS